MDRKYQSTAATAPQHRKQQQMSNNNDRLTAFDPGQPG